MSVLSSFANRVAGRISSAGSFALPVATITAGVNYAAQKGLLGDIAPYVINDVPRLSKYDYLSAAFITGVPAFAAAILSANPTVRVIGGTLGALTWAANIKRNQE